MYSSRQVPGGFDPGARARALAMLLDDPRLVLDAVGAMIVKESGKAFREQRLGGAQWKERITPNWPALLRDAEKGAATPPARRFQARPALHDTWLLSRSIAHRVVTKDTVEAGVAGVAKTYGDKHQVGGEVQTIPITAAIQARMWKWTKAARRAEPRAIGKARAAAGSPGEAAAEKSARVAVRRRAGMDALGWLLNKNLRGQRLRLKINARPFVGLPATLTAEIERTIGVAVRQVP